MSYPSTRIRPEAVWRPNRDGAIVPLFALLLPVLLIMCGFAINMAYMQAATTELKIATDCAAHAGGRAMSVAQSDESLSLREKRDLAIAEGISTARQIAQANQVLGRTLSIGGSGSGSEVEIGFGVSIRGDNQYGPGHGMYDYTETPIADVQSGDTRPSSLRVTGNLDLPFIFQVANASASVDSTGQTSSTFSPERTSISTQVNRDVALVLDRSGSMLLFRNEDALTARIQELYNTVRRFRFYRFSRFSSQGRWVIDGSTVPNSWIRTSFTQNFRLITDNDRSRALRGLYQRSYTNNVIYQLERFENSNHTLGSVYSSNERQRLTVPMAEYCSDYQYQYNAGRPGAPEHSRWSFLFRGVDAFLDVLDVTDQEELVSLVTFNNMTTVDFDLQKSTDDDGSQPLVSEGYPNIRRRMLTITPDGGTAVGEGLLDGLPPLIPRDNGLSRARPFAAKTIVVLTDGVSNAGTSPGEAVERIIGKANVTIHTVTFTEGADQVAMQDVARAGRGRHYHDDDGSQLVQIFEEIANNLPTILTQ